MAGGPRNQGQAAQESTADADNMQLHCVPPAQIVVARRGGHAGPAAIINGDIHHRSRHCNMNRRDFLRHGIVAASATLAPLPLWAASSEDPAAVFLANSFPDLQGEPI